MSMARYILAEQYVLASLGVFTEELRYFVMNGCERFGWCRSNLRCAMAGAARSSADARPRWIRMRRIRRGPSPPACRKHNRPGTPHARRTLCRPTGNRSRALLVFALPLYSLNDKARPEGGWSEPVNRGKRASAPSLPSERAYAALAAATL